MTQFLPPTSLAPAVRQLLHRRFGAQPELKQAVPLHLEDDLRRYHQQLDTFTQPGGLQAVWQAYVQQAPATAFAGPRVNFLLAYERSTGRIAWRGENRLPAFQPGLQVYCLLNLLGPRLIIGVEILRVDEVKHEMEVCYLSGGLFRGTQIIRLEAISAAQTRVVHDSFYYSGKFWLDRVAYPVFHRLTVGEFHRGVQRRLEA